MKLDGSYEFSELTQIEGIFVSNGRERASGKIIQIHLFPAGKSEQANRICQQLFYLPDEARNKILKYGQEGNASYFVTEPLPRGEYLQSWAERLSAKKPAPSLPEVSAGITEQLQRLGITPAPLAPATPGPESPQNVRSKVMAAPIVTQAPRPDLPAVHPGDMTREFRSVYGEESQANPDFPPEYPDAAAPEPLAVKAAPGLETFIGLHPEKAAAQAVSPPLSIPVEPARAQPVSFEDLPAATAHRPSLQQISPQPQLAGIPRTASPPPHKRPRPSPSGLDLKTVLLITAVLLVAAASVIAIVENSG